MPSPREIWTIQVACRVAKLEGSSWCKGPDFRGFDPVCGIWGIGLPVYPGLKKFRFMPGETIPMDIVAQSYGTCCCCRCPGPKRRVEIREQAKSGKIGFSRKPKKAQGSQLVIRARGFYWPGNVFGPDTFLRKMEFPFKDPHCADEDRFFAPEFLP